MVMVMVTSITLPKPRRTCKSEPTGSVEGTQQCVTAPRADFVRAVGIKLVMALVFAAIGVWVVSLAIDMVGTFGEGMGVDEHSRQVYRQSHIAVHIFGSASSIAIYLFVSFRKRLLTLMAIVAIVCCGGYGVVNMIGFTTTNRLAVAESKAASNAAEWKVYDARRAAIQADIDWSRKTEVTEENSRERRRLLSRIDAKLRELATIEPPRPSVATVLADPQATWFSRVTGWAQERWQLTLPVPVAVLLFGAEVFSFVFAVHLLLAAITGYVSIRSSRSHSGPPAGEGGGLKLVPPITVADHHPISADHMVAATRSAAPVQLDRVPSTRSADIAINPISAGVRMDLGQFNSLLEQYHAGRLPGMSLRALAKKGGRSYTTTWEALRRIERRADPSGRLPNRARQQKQWDMLEHGQHKPGSRITPQG
jgi:hypothetical protein